MGNNPNTGKPGVPLPDGVKLMQNANTAWPTSFKIAEDLSFSKKQSLDATPVANGGLGFDLQWNATLGYFVRKDFPSSGAISLADLVSGMTSTFNNVYLQSVAYVESHNELTDEKLAALSTRRSARPHQPNRAQESYSGCGNFIYITRSADDFSGR